MWRAGAQVSREPPPPIPGGYMAGDKVYYTGTSETFQSGNRLEHGQRGEVMGPTTSERQRGKGVAVLFPGNKGTINCRPRTAARARSRSARSACRRRAATRSACTPRRCSRIGR